MVLAKSLFSIAIPILIMGINPCSPALLEATHQTVTLRRDIDDFIAIMPIKEIQGIIVMCMAVDDDFRQTLEWLIHNLLLIWSQLLDNPRFQGLSTYLNEHNIDIENVKKMLIEKFSKAVKCSHKLKLKEHEKVSDDMSSHSLNCSYYKMLVDQNMNERSSVKRCKVLYIIECIRSLVPIDEFKSLANAKYKGSEGFRNFLEFMSKFLKTSFKNLVVQILSDDKSKQMKP